MRVGRSEKGFTIVEAVVAAVIITIVVAGVIYFISSAGRSQQRSSIRAEMSAASDSVIQKLRADRSWLERCNNGCTMSGDDYAPDNRGGRNSPEFKHQIQVNPVDSPADGVGANDRDQNTVDFYEVTVRISLSEEQQLKFGKQEDVVLVSTLDPNSIGVASGSLTVEVCEVTNQIDERMAIEGCLSSGTQNLEMRRQPEPCLADTEREPDKVREDHENAHHTQLGCNAALDAAAAGSDNRHTVQIQPTNSVNFQIRRNNSASSGTSAGFGTTYTPAQANRSTEGSVGKYVFPVIAAGTYDLTVNPPGGKEIWRSKMVPDSQKVSVQANQHGRALIVIRPTQGTSKYEVYFTRKVYRYVVESFSGSTTNTESPFLGVSPFSPQVRVQTNYTYARGRLVETPVWNGPSWSGFVSIEPKPFDRYRVSEEDSGKATESSLRAMQHMQEVTWKAENAEEDSKDHKVVFERANGFDMPTGLYSIPEQMMVKEEGLFGDFGERSLNCERGATCNGEDPFVWIAPGSNGGTPNSTVTFHDDKMGECYVRNNISGTDWEVWQGGEQPVKERGKNRCERGMMINGEWVEDFLPDREGKGGKTVVISAQQTFSCQSSPGGNTCASRSSGNAQVNPNSNGASGSNGSAPPQPSFNLGASIVAPSVVQCGTNAQIAQTFGVPCIPGTAGNPAGNYGGGSGVAQMGSRAPACVGRCGGRMN